MSDFLQRAQAAVDAGIAIAREREIRVAVVVLDTTFTLAAAQRLDGAYRSTVAVAQAKAHTALNFGRPTSALTERIKPENRQALQAVEPALMFVGGGVPIVVDGVTIGAVGVSGGSEDDDHECATAGASAAEAGT
jgi:glc operon protein GlcG